MLQLKKSIESHYITSYGAEISEVICYIFERNLKGDPLQDFIFSARDYSYFFKSEKLQKDIFTSLSISDAENIIISAIIKEVKYNEHFMSWEKGKEYLDLFFKELPGSKEIYTNSYWEKSVFNNIDKKEFELNAWSGISHNYWYDYGFIIVTTEKIGVLWFGDDS
ncbi:hypothetical protein J3D55_002887 [Chryseobacterium ginsenosidimutans]|uniref:hypothetical protein n=1 Tax=Chryseobacterium ginsenosidimutans TaxID=687846 RepID=UPI00216A59E9|nr:hypothetical protein [Chryseobacterium ginsenosidimutans]MCS3869971.1 hypothetical protein [Chryseobacterium ginsenosidimutans]